MSKMPVVEKRLLREFKRAYPSRENTPAPRYDDDLAWLALMQHHGAPTRLLDWTFSPFVAAFFALDQTENTIWRRAGLNPDKGINDLGAQRARRGWERVERVGRPELIPFQPIEKGTEQTGTLLRIVGRQQRAANPQETLYSVGLSDRSNAGTRQCGFDSGGRSGSPAIDVPSGGLAK